MDEIPVELTLDMRAIRYLMNVHLKGSHLISNMGRDDTGVYMYLAPEMSQSLSIRRPARAELHCKHRRESVAIPDRTAPHHTHEAVIARNDHNRIGQILMTITIADFLSIVATSPSLATSRQQPQPSTPTS